MSRWCLVLLLACLLMPAAAQEYYEEPTYECVSPVMPGQQGLLLGAGPLQAGPSWESEMLIGSVIEGETFTVLEGPVCGDDHNVWIKIDYQEQQGWFLIVQYGMCDFCSDDPPQFWAKLYSPLVPVTPTGDDPRLAPPVNQPSPQMLTLDNVASIAPAQSWGDGHLSSIGWTPDGQLQVVLDTETRLYNSNELTQPASIERAWKTYTKSPTGTVALVAADWPLTGQTLRDIASGSVLATFTGKGGVFDATGRYLAINVGKESYETESIIEVYEISEALEVTLIQTFSGFNEADFFKDDWLIAHTQTAYFALELATGRSIQLGATQSLYDQGDTWTKTLVSPDLNRFLGVYKHGSGLGSYFLLFVYNLTQFPEGVKASEFDVSGGEGSYPNPLIWSPDGRSFLVGASDQQSLYQMEPFDNVWEMNLPDVISAAFSPDGSLIALATDDVVHVYRDIQEIAVVKSSVMRSGGINLAFSPDNRILAVAGSGVTLWDTQTSDMIGSLTFDTFNTFRLNPEETEIQTGARRYDIASQSLIETLPPESPSIMRDSVSDSWSRQSVSQDRTLFVTYEEDDTRTARYIVRNTQTGEVVRTFEGYFYAHGMITGNPRLTPDNRLLIIADQTGEYSDDYHLLVFDIQTGDLLDVIQAGDGHESFVDDITVSADGKTLLWTTTFYVSLAVDDISAENWGHVYDLRTKATTSFNLNDHVMESGKIALNYDGSVAFIAVRDGYLTVWNTATGERIDVPSLVDKTFTEQMLMSKDGRRLYVTDIFGRFTIWGLPQ